jgi:hypothetical protein
MDELGDQTMSFKAIQGSARQTLRQQSSNHSPWDEVRPLMSSFGYLSLMGLLTPEPPANFGKPVTASS